MPFPQSLRSQKIGRLTPNVDDSDESILGLQGKCTLLEEGRFRICLPDIENNKTEQEWLRVIARFDNDYEALLKRIVKVRKEVEADVVKLRKEYFRREKFSGSPKELVRHFRLEHVNYYGDGLIGLWYEGDKSFHHLDLNVELDSEWRIQFVNFDG